MKGYPSNQRVNSYRYGAKATVISAKGTEIHSTIMIASIYTHCHVLQPHSFINFKLYDVGALYFYKKEKPIPLNEQCLNSSYKLTASRIPE